MEFCEECNNLLQPREDKESRELVFACRSCDHQRPADSNRVKYNEIRKGAEKLDTDIGDQAADPSLARVKDQSLVCEQCGHTEIAFRQSPYRRDEDPMVLLFMCCNQHCRHVWLQNTADEDAEMD